MCKCREGDVNLGSVINIISMSSSFKSVTTSIPLFSKNFLRFIANKLPPPRPSTIFEPILTHFISPKSSLYAIKPSGINKFFSLMGIFSIWFSRFKIVHVKNRLFI